MALAEELQEVLPGVYTWQAFCSSAKVELTSHAIVSNGGLYLVDPIRLSKDGLEQLGGLMTDVAAVLLTSGNHARDATFYGNYFQVPIYANAEAATEFEFATEVFPEELGGLEIIPLPGAGLGEVGIYDREKKLLCLGDIIINLDSFTFAPLPGKYATNEKQMRKSIESLKALDVSTICFAHGLPIMTQATTRLRSLC